MAQARQRVAARVPGPGSRGDSSGLDDFDFAHLINETHPFGLSSLLEQCSSSTVLIPAAWSDPVPLRVAVKVPTDACQTRYWLGDRRKPNTNTKIQPL